MHLDWSINVVSLAAMVAILASGAAIARPDAPPQVLAPSSPWNMDYAQESCRLIRAFGPAEQSAMIKLEKFSLTDRPSLMVVGKRFSSDSPFAKVRLGFGDAPVAEHPALTGSIGDARKPMMIVSSVDVIPHPPQGSIILPDPAAERRVSSLTIQPVGGKVVMLQLGPMDKPMEAMRTCIDSLVKSWGLDPTVQRTLSRQLQPLSSPVSWVVDNDYPRVAIQGGENGLVHFRLMIDDAGKPVRCVIQSKTKPDDFAPTVCAVIMRRARFQPALDAQGKPVASYFASAVRFQMEH